MKHPTNKKDRLDIGNNKADPAFKTYYSRLGTKDDLPGHFGVLRKTRKLCSSPYCCGNPRRKKGSIELTMQELKKQYDEEVDNGMENDTLL